MCYGELLSQKMVKARREHWCAACSKPILKGMKYVKTVAVVAGDFQMSKMCPRCQAMLEAYYQETNYDEDYCFSLSDLRSLVREWLDATGTWGRFKANLRKRLTGGPSGSWHT